MKISLPYIDVVTTINDKLENEFVKNFGNYKPIRIAGFGLPIDFNLMDNITDNDTINFKRKFAISINKITIVCGGSGDPLRQHYYILNEIRKLSEKVLSNLAILVPMTYGDKSYIEKFKKYCKDEVGDDVEIHIFTDYMEKYEVACLRKSSDIFINIPKTDTFSATMREAIYCKSIVINGSWLPYLLLDKKKIFYLKLENDTPRSLTKLLTYIYNNYADLKKMNDLDKFSIKEISSWNCQIYSWIDVYNELLICSTE